jgi:ankyrin repeat protein
MYTLPHRKYEVAEMLGRYGADVNIRDNNGSTAYDIATVIGNSACKWWVGVAQCGGLLGKV